MIGYVMDVCTEYYGSRGETPKLNLREKQQEYFPGTDI